MKVLGIVATNRRKGSIANICTHYLQGAKEAGHDTQIINLYDYQTKPPIVISSWTFYIA